MKIALMVWCAVLIGVVGCSHSAGADADHVRTLIQAQIDEGIEGTRNKDIDRFMGVVPKDWALHDGEGHVVTRDDLRRDDRPMTNGGKLKNIPHAASTTAVQPSALFTY